MSQTYSTLQRDAAGGRVYSSRQSQVTVLPAGQGPTVQRVVPTPPAPAAAPQGSPAPTRNPVASVAAVEAPVISKQFTLGPTGQKAAAQIGPQASGRVGLTGNAVTAEIAGVNPLRDQAVQPTLWLVADLTVPTDLSPQDLAALPKGSTGTGNQPGTVYTMDGNPATYGPTSNTISVSVSPGTFALQPDSALRLTGVLDNRTNQAYHPLVVLGPSVMADMNAALPSGTVARILADLFMRPATVHPELDLRSQFAQRLAAITRDVLSLGVVDFLAPSRYDRAAVTLEGPVRTTPRLMPTPNTCFLMALRAD